MVYEQQFVTMGKDYGQPLKHDSDTPGLISNRSHTDLVALIIFICFMVLWACVGSYAIKYETATSFLHPKDSKGRQCGISPGLENKPYLVFFDIIKCLQPPISFNNCKKTTQVCVENCPKNTTIASSITADNFKDILKDLLCVDNVKITVSMTIEEIMALINNGSCATYVIQSKPILGRCFPLVDQLENVIGTGLEMAKGADKKSTIKTMKYIQIATKVLHDLMVSKWHMLGGLVTILIICFIYILLLRWIVAPVVWLSIVAVMGILSFTTYLCVKQYMFYRDKTIDDTIFLNSKTWLCLSAVSGSILLILLLIIIFLRKRINLAIALIQEGSKAIIAVKSTIFFPIFPWLVKVCTVVYAVAVLIFLISIDGPIFDYKNILSPMYLHPFNIFAFFWCSLFIDAVADMMLAGTFSTWYWTFHKHDLPFFTLSSAILRTRYHLGTAAFGSLIIAFVSFFRSLLQYMSNKTNGNPCSRVVICLCKCVCFCLEKFLKFINRNAFIMCAIEGKSFCTSARDAFSLLMRNIVRVVVIDQVTGFVFFLSKIMVSLSVGFGIYYLLELDVFYESSKLERLNYNYIPAIILAVATYLICVIFFTVYEMAVDTLFLCFLEDCERNDGSAVKPYYMSKNLMRLLKR